MSGHFTFTFKRKLSWSLVENKQQQKCFALLNEEWEMARWMVANSKKFMCIKHSFHFLWPELCICHARSGVARSGATQALKCWPGSGGMRRIQGQTGWGSQEVSSRAGTRKKLRQEAGGSGRQQSLRACPVEKLGDQAKNDLKHKLQGTANQSGVRLTPLPRHFLFLCRGLHGRSGGTADPDRKWAGC